MSPRPLVPLSPRPPVPSSPWRSVYHLPPVSLKYQRIKKADEALPAPLRWLTRAFSSITLSVILLAIVAVYGTLATVPLAMLALGAAYGGIIASTHGLALVGSILLVRGRANWPLWVKALVVVAAVAAALPLTIQGLTRTYWAVTATDWYAQYRATVIYRLPFFEMTELEFYGWWPFQVVLLLFVVNMVWATVRRIEFSIPRLGVLTVHFGIILIALGSVFYSRLKVEGDTVLWRADLVPGGERAAAVRTFYDATQPALYVSFAGDPRGPAGGGAMIPLPELPRYNDYPLGALGIDLTDRPELRRFTEPIEAGGGRLRLSIPGFIAVGELRDAWRSASKVAEEGEALGAGTSETHPLLSAAFVQGDVSSEGAGGLFQPFTLVADSPAGRVVDTGEFAVEVLHAPSPERVRDLITPMPEGAEHAVIVEVPQASGEVFRKVYGIEEGATITVGETGYTLRVDAVGPYGMPFVTEGYQGARDTRVQVHVEGNGKEFTRIALHRYPERTQDFLPEVRGTEGTRGTQGTSSLGVGGEGGVMGDLGKRVDPDEDIRVTYLDGSRPQFHLIMPEGADSVDDLELLVRVGGVVRRLPLSDEVSEIPLPPDGAGRRLALLGVVPDGVRVREPVPTPDRLRDPKDEGTYVPSLVPVRVEYVPPDGGDTFRRTVWLNHMRYPMLPDEERRPELVDVPGLGPLSLVFSRRQYHLPFALTLTDFEMTPYPHSTIPLDFTSTILIDDLDDDGIPQLDPERRTVHMNHPTHVSAPGAPFRFHTLKLSQNSWDPPDEDDPAAEARNAEGKYVNQQRFSVLGVSNNLGVWVIAAGACCIAVGTPWAFWVKPWLIQRRKRRLQRQVAEERAEAKRSAAIREGLRVVRTEPGESAV